MTTRDPNAIRALALEALAKLEAERPQLAGLATSDGMLALAELLVVLHALHRVEEARLEQRGVADAFEEGARLALEGADPRVSVGARVDGPDRGGAVAEARGGEAVDGAPRAVELEQTDLTDFVLRTALREAKLVIERHERLKLSERDSQRVLDLLEHPPAPNARLRKAARALPVPK